MKTTKPKVGDIYEMPGGSGGSGSWKVVAIDTSPYNKGRYKRYSMVWKAPWKDSFDTGVVSYFTTKQINKWGATKKTTKTKRAR